MHTRNLCTALAVGMLGCTAAAGGAAAAETGLTVYGLGGAGFNAGATPPAGTYVTSLAAYYTGVIEGTVTVGGVDVDAGAEIGFFQKGLNVLYVPDTKVLGGSLGLSSTLILGHIDLSAELTAAGMTVSDEVSGWGLGDTWVKGQIGWAPQENFLHTAYIQGLIPTGKYDKGFEPNIGLHRPAIDAGWAFTWIEPSSKVQVNGQIGMTYNFLNTETDYQSGVDLHLDWAVGKDFDNGLILGVVGYNYRQLTGDSGDGAHLGAFKGSVDAVGLGANFSTKLGDIPTTFSLRHYEEFDVTHRFDGSTTLATATFAF